MRNDHLGKVARPRTISGLLGDRDMDESIVACPARHPMGQHVLTPLAIGEHHLDPSAELLTVLLQGDVADQVDEAVVALLDDRLGDLIRPSWRPAFRAGWSTGT